MGVALIPYWLGWSSKYHVNKLLLETSVLVILQTKKKSPWMLGKLRGLLTYHLLRSHGWSGCDLTNRMPQIIALYALFDWCRDVIWHYMAQNNRNPQNGPTYSKYGLNFWTTQTGSVLATFGTIAFDLSYHPSDPGYRWHDLYICIIYL